MSFKTLSLAAFTAACFISPLAAVAGDIVVHDPYAISARPNAPTGAAFMAIMNNSDQDDRLVGVASSVAKKVELHTHISDAAGVMRMVRIDGGIDLPAGATHMMQRGGDHVMFMGLTMPLVQGEEVQITFTFEKAGEMNVIIPVDLERKADHGAASH